MSTLFSRIFGKKNPRPEEPVDDRRIDVNAQTLGKDLEINPSEVAQLLKQGTIRLLDVRTPQEYEIAHVEGSTLTDQSLAQEIVATWPKDTEIVTMCHHGMRSLDAAAYLRGHGFNNTRSMRGGIEAWSNTVDPTIPRY